MSTELIKQDNCYRYDDQDYDDLGDAIQQGLLGFCACGRPEENLEYIMVGLELIAEKCPDATDWDTWWKEYDTKVQQHFGNLAAAYFFYYCADKAGLTEHGSSVPGWLTDKGEELLNLLHQWNTEALAAVETTNADRDSR